MNSHRAAAIAARAHEALRPSVPKQATVLRQNGRPVPHLLRWADQLGIPTAWLLDGDDAPLLIAAARSSKASRKPEPTQLAQSDAAGGATSRVHAKTGRVLPRRGAKG